MIHRITLILITDFLMRYRLSCSLIAKQPLKASALGMALIISFLVALICGFFVIRTHLNTLSEMHYSLKDKLERNCLSGIQYLLSAQTEIQPDQTLALDLYDSGLDSVEISRKTWGAFEIIGTKAFDNGIEKRLYALVGGGPVHPSDRTGLYVNDLDRPISICGHSKLMGKTYIPDEGIKRSYIEGQNYVGEQLIYGQEFTSKRNLPEINKALIQSLSQRIHGRFHATDSIESFTASNDTLLASFDQPTLVYQTNDLLIVGQKLISGNIALYSSEKIIVASESRLDGIILYAPEIEFQSGFTGTVQAFASKRIHVAESVILEYPSVLGIITDPSPTNEIPGMTIESDSKLYGSLIAVREEIPQSTFPTITLSEHFEMEGEMYVDGNLDLKGSINGSVWCNKIVLKTNSGVYENHLLNVIINPGQLSPHYLGTAFFEFSKKSVLKWL